MSLHLKQVVSIPTFTVGDKKSSLILHTEDLEANACSRFSRAQVGYGYWAQRPFDADKLKAFRAFFASPTQL